MFFSNSLAFQRSSGYWQFDLWFLCLFLNQLEHLEVHRLLKYCWGLAWRILSITLLACEMSAFVRSWWRGLTECGSLEKGMANHFSILALRTPWTEAINKPQRLFFYEYFSTFPLQMPPLLARINLFLLLCWSCSVLNLEDCTHWLCWVVLICLESEDAAMFRTVRIPVLMEPTIWWERQTVSKNE